MVGHKPMFRSRLHTIHDSEYFSNEHDLTFRYDAPNITSFGRCNEPMQSLFYASDNIQISLAETFNKEKLETLKPVSYITTGVWKFVENVMVAPIFEPDSVDIANPSLIDVTKKCKDFINSLDFIAQKDLLINFLKDIANEFSKPFSIEPNAYLFSAAYSNFMFEAVDLFNPNKKMEGIVYPTCKGIANIRHIGLNYAFKPLIVGFGQKIELISALRGRLIKVGTDVTAEDVIEAKHIDRTTGIITWH